MLCGWAAAEEAFQTKNEIVKKTSVLKTSIESMCPILHLYYYRNHHVCLSILTPSVHSAFTSMFRHFKSSRCKLYVGDIENKTFEVCFFVFLMIEKTSQESHCWMSTQFLKDDFPEHFRIWTWRQGKEKKLRKDHNSHSSESRVCYIFRVSGLMWLISKAFLGI